MSAGVEQIERAYLDAVCPRGLRSFLQFAEQEVVFARGPRAGLRFDPAYMPWTRLVLKEFENPYWRWRLGMGSVQSGKTMLFYVIPAMYHLFEIGETIILAAPKVQLAHERWEIDIQPVIERTRYRELIPRSGAGSRGGRSGTILFNNGARVFFMGAGGDDTQRSSHTSRVVLVTESDKMDEAGEVSRETTPLRQLAARTSAYGEGGLFYGECTVSITEGFIYQQASVHGSGSRIYLRCPHCRQWIFPDREHFTGWREPDNEIDAGVRSRYACNACGVAWTEAARRRALRHVKLIHRGQEVTPEGAVTGPLPKTHTLGIEWNWLVSPMTPMSQIGSMEWAAERAVTDAEDKDLTQFRWVQPWKEDLHVRDLSTRFLAQHTGEFHHDPLRDQFPELPKAELPEGPRFYTCAVDVQKRRLYAMLDGWDDALTRWSVHWRLYYIVEEEDHHDPTEDQLRAALDKVYEMAFEKYRAASLWVDAGYRADNLPEHVVRKWCGERDGANALVGRSATEYAKLTGKHAEVSPSIPASMIQARVQVDGNLLWFLDVDKLKDDLYSRLYRPQGAPGYHWFAREAANERRTDRSHGQTNPGWLFAHFMRVRREIARDHQGREVRTWREIGAHDMVDVAVYGLAGAIIARSELEDTASRQAASAAPALDVSEVPVIGSSRIRTSY